MYRRNGTVGTVKTTVRLGEYYTRILDKYPVANQYVNDCLGEYLKKLERGASLESREVFEGKKLKSVRLYIAKAYYEAIKLYIFYHPDFIVTSQSGRKFKKTTMTAIIKQAIENGNARTNCKDSLPSHQLPEELQQYI